MRTTIAALVLALTTTTAVAAPRHKAHKPRAESRWMRDCITERTGPTEGLTVSDARRICTAEQPEDEVSAAKAALVLARMNAKVAKAKARVAKAIEACEQAVVDRCVEFAKPDGSTDCEDAALRTEFNLACLASEGR
jgi:hypothetical protein